MLLVVVAVIAYVAMRNWKAVAPEALEIQRHNAARAGGHEVSPEAYEPGGSSAPSSGDAWTESPPARPSLGTMEQRTDAHSAAIRDALKQAN